MMAHYLAFVGVVNGHGIDRLSTSCSETREGYSGSNSHLLVLLLVLLLLLLGCFRLLQALAFACASGASGLCVRFWRFWRFWPSLVGRVPPPLI